MKQLIKVLLSLVFVIAAVGCAGKQGKTAGTTPSQKGSAGAPADVASGDVVVPTATDQPVASGTEAEADSSGMTGDDLSANARMMYNDGVKAGISGNLNEAEQAFARAIEEDPEAFAAYYNLGVVYERQGLVEKAKAQYLNALEKRSDYGLAISALVRIYVREGQPEKAVEVAKAGYEASSDNIMLICYYADALIAMESYSEAIRTAKKALRIDEKSTPAMTRLAKANFYMGRFELAQSILDQVISINTENADAHFFLGMLALNEDQKARAIAKFKDALKYNPYHVEALNNLAVQYILAGNYENAVKELEKAISVSPSWAILYLNYGNALRGAKRWQESKNALEKAREMDPSLTGALFNLGVLFFTADALGELDRLSRLTKAKEYFAMYRNEQGVNRSDDKLAKKYIDDLATMIERENVRIQREKEAAEREAAREAERASGGGDEGGDGWEDESGNAAEDDGGWEDEDGGAAKDESGGGAGDEGWEDEGWEDEGWE